MYISEILVENLPNAIAEGTKVWISALLDYAINNPWVVLFFIAVLMIPSQVKKRRYY